MAVSLMNYTGRNTESYKVTIGALHLWFSYETIVAFTDKFGNIQVCENRWGVTTGRHLNEIDGGDKEARLGHEEFQLVLNETLEHFGLA